MSKSHKLKELVLLQMQRINKQDTPILFNITQSKKGKQRIAKKVTERIIKDFLPVKAIIPYMENENCL